MGGSSTENESIDSHPPPQYDQASDPEMLPPGYTLKDDEIDLPIDEPVDIPESEVAEAEDPLPKGDVQLTFDPSVDPETHPKVDAQPAVDPAINPENEDLPKEEVQNLEGPKEATTNEDITPKEDAEMVTGPSNDSGYAPIAKAINEYFKKPKKEAPKVKIDPSTLPRIYNYSKKCYLPKLPTRDTIPPTYYDVYAIDRYLYTVRVPTPPSSPHEFRQKRIAMDLDFIVTPPITPPPLELPPHLQHDPIVDPPPEKCILKIYGKKVLEFIKKNWDAISIYSGSFILSILMVLFINRESPWYFKVLWLGLYWAGLVVLVFVVGFILIIGLVVFRNRENIRSYDDYLRCMDNYTMAFLHAQGQRVYNSQPASVSSIP